MADLLLIARLGGRRVAIPAGQVEAVVEVEAIVPAPRSAPHVAGLSALRSRVLTVIDARAALGFGRSALGGPKEAIVVPCDGHAYAVLVDQVEDVVEAAGGPAPAGAPLGPGWEQAAIGIVEAEGDLLLLIDPSRLIAGAAAQAA